MTVLLLRPYATFAQGATVDLDNATEASLVAQGRATYTVNPGPAFEPLTAAEQQTLRHGGGFTLTQAQQVATQALVSEAWMSDAILALIGFHPSRVYLDSQPLWLDNSPVLS
jgi:hypothetical protein